MKNPYPDDNFLARWLSNNLTTNEKEEFEKSEDYKKYKRIIDKVDTLGSLPYDKKKLFNSIQRNIEKESKTIQLVPKWIYGVAATLLMIMGLFVLCDSSTKYSTDFGEQTSLTLPDGSEVILNSKSSLKFKKADWDTNRTVTLTGEAFFKVKKGSDFLVNTSSGDVSVLGTQFNVNSSSDFFEVMCHEGKVKAIGTAGKTIILTKQKAYRIVGNTVENWDIKELKPSWLSGETTFLNTPLKQVIESLQNQFDLTFDKNDINEHKRFTGSYSHNDIELALKTIFVPMEISFTLKNKNNVILTKK
ncbi:FecR family protein [Aquimarina sp. RZ0]|uniref:FecR family protein n=1 Tax=Aquimarina sp. RZ0 TaxID=2607730 RepID=UPI0011F2D0D3|nr:FecR family protein [Aquimarina sp. RZ0]KAA1243579.1 FecR family protein [Aquimarina sp. RZ0]